MIPSAQAAAQPGHTILLVQAPGDRSGIRRALGASQAFADLRTVSSAEDTLANLRRSGAYTAPGAAPRASRILLDMHMPCEHGRATLAVIKSDHQLHATPLLVFLAGHTLQDVRDCYDLGANSVISIPTLYDALLAVLSEMLVYWFEQITLPISSGGNGGWNTI